MSQEDKRKARSIAKGLFTRAKNTLTHCIDSGDDSDIIVRKLDDLDRRYTSLVEKHQLYISEIENEADYNETKEEEWMEGIEKEYLSTERLTYSYIKEVKAAHESTENLESIKKPATSIVPDTDESKHNSTEHEQTQTMRDFEKSEFMSLTNRIRKLTLNNDLDMVAYKSLLNSAQEDLKRQFDRCKDMHVKFLSCLPRHEVNDHLSWTEELNEVYYEVSTLMAKQINDDKGEEKAVPQACRLKLQPMPLPKFSGEIREYPRFKDDFKTQVVPSISPTQQSYVLKSCLTGPPLDIVKNVDHSIVEMWKRLDDKYGEPSKIIDVVMYEIKKIKQVKEGDTSKFIQMVEIVERAYRDLERLHLHEQVSNASTVSMIEEKLPLSIRMKWSEQVNSRKAIIGVEVNKFPMLLRFLLETRSVIEYALSDLRSESSASGSVNFVDSTKDKNVRVMSNSDRRSSASACLLHPQDLHVTSACPQFLEMDIKDRIELVKEKRACWSCLYTGHKSSNCYFKKKCNIDDCNRRHNKLLHTEEDEEKNAVEQPDNQAAICTDKGAAIHTLPTRQGSGACLLQLMDIKVNDNGNVTVLWDGGATVSLITFDKANELGLEGEAVNLAVTKVGGKTEEINSYRYTLPLQNKNGGYAKFVVYGIDKISIPVKAIDISPIKKLFDDDALSEINRPCGEIHVLIGFEYAGYHPLRITCKKHLLLMKNQFGTCLGGYHPNLFEEDVKVIKHAYIHYARGIDIEDFYDTEGLGIQCTPRCGSCRCGKCPVGAKNYTIQEERELQLIEDGLVRHTGYWEAKYPWIKDPSLIGNNYHVALSMLKSTERRLLKDRSHAETYQSQIQDMVKRGVAVKIDRSVQDNYHGPVHYIGHHEVLKKESTTPCRIVFNSSAKFNGLSLNDCWAKGPDVLNNMLGILIRFREGSIAITGDIKKMYHSVYLSELDQHVHRFLWRDLDNSRDPDIYTLTRCSFGDKPASTITTLALRKTAQENESKYPEAVKIILDNTYVDDIIDSRTASVLDVTTIVQQMKEVLQCGNFEVKQWISNKDLLISNKELLVSVGDVSHEKSKVLGMHWNPVTDGFEFKACINFSPKIRKIRSGPNLTVEQLKALKPVFTKRMILSQINGIYDPLGLLVPFTIKAKILMQQLWLNEAKELGWDDLLPSTICSEWLAFFIDMFDVEDIMFERCVRPDNAIDNPMLIIFSDASEEAYGTCAYVRWECQDSSISTSLLCSKGKVAPTKRVSMPRLELCAAVIGKRIFTFIDKECRYQYSKVIFVVDSEIIHAMIQRESYGFKTYAGVRIGEIQTATCKDAWAWTDTDNNIADWITRPKKPVDLGGDSVWQSGPAWLRFPESDWPIFFSSDVEDLPEIHKHVVVHSTAKVDKKSLIDISRFSKYSHLLRVTARVLALKKENPSLFSVGKELVPNDISNAETYWIREVQSIYSDKDVANKFRRLGAKKRNDGIIVVGARMESWMKSCYKEDMVLLPYEHKFSKLYVESVHYKTHCGVAATVCKVRLKFWIIKLYKLAKKIKFECVKCRILAKICEEQIMGQLPDVRLQPAPAWSTISLDILGPFLVRGETNKRSRGKAYGVVLNCMVTRAVHLDVLVDYSTDGFIQAFRRFMSVRGAPLQVYSDPGSQLQGASKELKDMYANVDQVRLKEFGCQNGFEWNFTSADSPWQNGCSEALIKSVKKAMENILGSQVVSFSELLTIMYEIANLMNERPIGKKSLDVEDGTYLCPNDMLLGRATSKIPSGTYDFSSSLVKRHKFVQSIIDAFWIKWTRYYFYSLIIRQKWHVDRRNLRVGDVVIIQDSKIKRGDWKMGRISQVYPGSDGKVRKVEVEYKNPDSNSFVKIERAVQRLVVILPIDEAQENGGENGGGNVSF